MRFYDYIRRHGFFLLAWTLMASAPAAAAELVMVEEEGCVYCDRFNREIAPAYPKTREGRIAPLRRVVLGQGWPADLSQITPTPLTPTFILIENGVEVDRLAGYPGDEHFWFLLGQMLEQL